MKKKIKEGSAGIPSWFSWLFILTIVGSIVYGIVYHFGYNWSSAEEYKQAVEKKINKNEVPVIDSLTAEGVNPYRGNTEAINAGLKTYTTFCAACHKADASGLVGPNLIDSTWLHGNTDKAMYDVIMNGVTIDKAKQQPVLGPMPAHKNSVGSKKVLELLAWLASKNDSLKGK